MLFTALFSFVIAFFAQAVDPTWDGIAVFMWMGIVSAALTGVGVVYALTMDTTRPIYAHPNDHAHSHA